MQEQKPKKDYKKHNALSYRSNVVLTIQEGETLKKIISDNDCKNLSQLCKKIVHGEISIY